MNGLFTYFSGPSGLLSILVIAIILASVAMLIRWHFQPGDFDLRDALTAPTPDGKRRVDTSKAILVGVFLVSSYLVADNYSEGALGLYLGAWILNGGAVLAYKVFSKGNGNAKP